MEASFSGVVVRAIWGVSRSQGDSRKDSIHERMMKLIDMNRAHDTTILSPSIPLTHAMYPRVIALNQTCKLRLSCSKQ